MSNGCSSWFGNAYSLFCLQDPILDGTASPTGAFGWSGYHNTYFWIDRQNGIYGLFMTRTTPFSSEIQKRFRAGVYNSLWVRFCSCLRADWNLEARQATGRAGRYLQKCSNLFRLRKVHEVRVIRQALFLLRHLDQNHFRCVLHSSRPSKVSRKHQWSWSTAVTTNRFFRCHEGAWRRSL